MHFTIPVEQKYAKMNKNLKYFCHDIHMMSATEILNFTKTPNDAMLSVHTLKEFALSFGRGYWQLPLVTNKGLLAAT